MEALIPTSLIDWSTREVSAEIQNLWNAKKTAPTRNAAGDGVIPAQMLTKVVGNEDAEDDRA